MARVGSYYKKPSDSWKSCVDEITIKPLYMISRPAPVIFRVFGGEENGKEYKVTIGNPHTCSCGCKPTEFCSHIVFCLTKILRLSLDDPLCWQRAFTDIELESALQKECTASSVRTKESGPVEEEALDDKDASTSVENDVGVKRRTLDGDDADICPICQDNMAEDQLLTWCRKGCGKNMHAACMDMLLKFATKNSRAGNVCVECPLCRIEFDTELLKQDCRGKLTIKYQAIPVYCCKAFEGTCYAGGSRYDMHGNRVNGKHASLNCDFFRCLECSNASFTSAKAKYIDYCQSCFLSNCVDIKTKHSEHHFVNSNGGIIDVRDVHWIPYANPYQKSSSSQSSSRPTSAGTLRRQAIAQIVAQRELTPDDYDVLLQLDVPNAAPVMGSVNRRMIAIQEAFRSITPAETDISQFLVSSLKQVKVGSIAGACWCGVEKENDSVLLRELQHCQHSAHDDCIVQVLKDSMVNDENGECERWKLVFAVCQHEGCKTSIFPCLNRSKVKKQPVVKPAADNCSLVINGSSTLSKKPLVVAKSAFGHGTTSERLVRSESPQVLMELAGSSINVSNDAQSKKKQVIAVKPPNISREPSCPVGGIALMGTAITGEKSILRSSLETAMSFEDSFVFNPLDAVNNDPVQYYSTENNENVVNSGNATTNVVSGGYLPDITARRKSHNGKEQNVSTLDLSVFAKQLTSGKGNQTNTSESIEGKCKIKRVTSMNSIRCASPVESTTLTVFGNESSKSHGFDLSIGLKTMEISKKMPRSGLVKGTNKGRSLSVGGVAKLSGSRTLQNDGLIGVQFAR